jgi:thiol-disulfide isomerase/thioredoxin
MDFTARLWICHTRSQYDPWGKKAVYLKFWATWCTPCRQQMPHFENVYQHAGSDLAVIALNAGFSETLQDIKDYRGTLNIHMPIVVDDGSLAGLFNLRITPQHVVIGKDGTVKYVGNRADAVVVADSGGTIVQRFEGHDPALAAALSALKEDKRATLMRCGASAFTFLFASCSWCCLRVCARLPLRRATPTRYSLPTTPTRT